VALVGAAILMFLVEHPRQVGLPSPAEGSVRTGPAEPAAGRPYEAPMSLLEALRLPGILNLGGAYFCLKLIRYTLLFWLPFYLHKALNYPEDMAGYLSTTFEIGGIAGAIIIGYLSDRFAAGRRVMFAAPMVLLIGVAMAIYQVVGGWGMWANGISMALVGFLLFGPDSLLSGAAAQDLGGPRAAGSAAGIINGLGSLGAILEGVVTAQVTERFGWNSLFSVLIGLSTLATVVLMPLFLRALKRKPM
jgi:sugar phosphate permease